MRAYAFKLIKLIKLINSLISFYFLCLFFCQYAVSYEDAGVKLLGAGISDAVFIAKAAAGLVAFSDAFDLARRVALTEGIRDERVQMALPVYAACTVRDVTYDDALYENES